MNKQEIIIEKLKNVKGKELKYKDLCQELNIPVKAGDSKKAQLKSLETYCKLIKLEKPTRYLITEVYEEQLKVLGYINGHNKFQLMFEAALYQMFLNNGGKPFYLSKSDALRLFTEVNENFSYAQNANQMKELGKEYEYMTNMSKIIFNTLSKWTMRRIEEMHNRSTVTKNEGFRLYKKSFYKFREYTIATDVPQNSEMEKICQEIYNQAIEEIMPEDWGKIKRPEEELEQIKELENEEKKKSGKYWVPDYKWKQFENRIAELTKEKFNDNYDYLRIVMILKPPTLPYVINKLNKLCKELEGLTHINEEACRKALTIPSLDYATNIERKKFIEINMKQNPPVSFKEMLNKIYDEKYEWSQRLKEEQNNS